MKRPTWQRYAGAILLTLLVVAVRAALDPWLGHSRNRHLVFLPTVMVAAWYGGFRAGVVSAILSCAALYAYWGDEPFGNLYAPTSDQVLFAALSVAICGIIETLQAARARADALTRSRERVLAVVAHDLRSPLSAIKTVADGIVRAVPHMQPRLDRIHRAVARMDDLIRDLVDTTRIEHGQLVVTVRPEPVEPIIQEATGLFTPLAQEQGIAFDAAPVPAGAVVLCDRNRVVQVLSNLIGNALKFTPAGGRITLAAEEQREAVRFVVADTGSGITAENLPHVFDPFWKGDEKGTGLGLFIARSIVQAHDGRIDVQSTPGSGATFAFTLPRPLQARSRRTPNPAAPVEEPQKT